MLGSSQTTPSQLRRRLPSRLILSKTSRGRSSTVAPTWTVVALFKRIRIFRPTLTPRTEFRSTPRPTTTQTSTSSSTWNPTPFAKKQFTSNGSCTTFLISSRGTSARTKGPATTATALRTCCARCSSFLSKNRSCATPGRIFRNRSSRLYLRNKKNSSSLFSRARSFLVTLLPPRHRIIITTTTTTATQVTTPRRRQPRPRPRRRHFNRQRSILEATGDHQEVLRLHLPTLAVLSICLSK